MQFAPRGSPLREILLLGTCLALALPAPSVLAAPASLPDWGAAATAPAPAPAPAPATAPTPAPAPAPAPTSEPAAAPAADDDIILPDPGPTPVATPRKARRAGKASKKPRANKAVKSSLERAASERTPIQEHARSLESAGKLDEAVQSLLVGAQAYHDPVLYLIAAEGTLKIAQTRGRAGVADDNRAVEYVRTAQGLLQTADPAAPRVDPEEHATLHAWGDDLARQAARHKARMGVRRNGHGQLIAGGLLATAGLAGLGVMSGGLYLSGVSKRELAKGEGRPEEELQPLRDQQKHGETMIAAGEVFREALSKLVNSLSHGILIKPPVAIDKDRLIYRIDIGDYKWEAVEGKQFRLSEPSFYFPEDDISTRAFTDVWEMIADQNPYTIEYLGDVAINIKTQTHTNVPIMPGEAFLDAASRSPLYYDILGIPLRSARLRAEDPPCGAKGTPEECLETQLNIDILADIAKEFDQNTDIVGRAGFKESKVSDFNRVVERHLFNDTNNRVFWISYDFKSQTGLKNILTHPLDFDFDGGEIIFSLENGLQGYMLTNAAGGRLNDGPTEIVQDPSQEDQIVRNGVSCMGCHSAGMLAANDDIRAGLDAGMTGTLFDDTTKGLIRDLYPTREDFKLLQQEDTDRFNLSLSKAGVTLGGEEEPVLTTFLSFDEDVTLRRVGAEYDLNETDMLKNLGKLGDDLSDLAEGASIHRKDFTENFRVGACILKIGCTRTCPGEGAPASDRTCGVTDIDGDGDLDQL